MRLLLVSIHFYCKYLLRMLKYSFINIKNMEFQLPNFDLKRLLKNFTIKKSYATVFATIMMCFLVGSSFAFNSKTVFAVNTPETTTDIVNIWWKADVTAYDNMSLVDYGTATIQSKSAITPPIEYYPENPVVTTTAVTEIKPVVTSILDVEPPPAVDVPPITPNKPTVTPEVGTFSFITYGYGHGVGLSQNGANFYAKYGGYNYRQILEHYYPGVTIAQSGLSETEQFTIDGGTHNAIDAVAGAVMNEVSTSFHDEAIKAQIVAVYSIFKANNNDANGMHMRPAPEKIYNLVREVFGEACYYDGKYAMTVFSASAAGASANSYDVFGGDLPYLRSVPSIYDEAYDPHYGTVKEISATRVRELIEAYFEVKLSNNPSNWFTITSVGDGGYVQTLDLDGQKTIKATSLRNCLSLKSTNFEIVCG
ncbi:hypothetical protein FACS1894132_05100 [Clostridia bacterium]|nr:hypothetical protein FACS1894132_05100 [Clostridia bacterium]